MSAKVYNPIFPPGNFYRTHVSWDRKKKFSRLDRLKCFFGFHVPDFFNAGITPHCASCRWYHNTTLLQRVRYWRYKTFVKS